MKPSDLPPDAKRHFEVWSASPKNKWSDRDECFAAGYAYGRSFFKADPVVVPELTDAEVEELVNQQWDHRGLIDVLRACVKAGFAASRARTIGPGEVVVNAEEWRIYREWEAEARAQGRDQIRFPELLRLDALDALRNQATTSGESAP